MLRFFLLATVLVLLLGCSTLPGANPTPVIIVVTATPEGTRSPVVSFFTPTPPAGSQTTRTPAATADPNGTPAPVDTATLNLKATDVKYVLAKQDINIRNGPGTNFEIVGGVFAGNTAQVTGYQSADGLWWRVVCPVDNVTDCWVSADSALTEPTQGPEAAPTTTTTVVAPTTTTLVAPTITTEVNLETFTRQLATAFQSKNYDTLTQLMGDPFTIAYWRSEGTNLTRTQGLTQLKVWLDPAQDIVVDLADKTDQGKLLDGTPPLQMWNPAVKAVKSVFVEGMGADQKGQGLIVIAQRDDNSLYWYAFLYAAGGFDTLN